MKAKVVAVSSNANSFGLRGMVTANGQGWEAAANDINLKPIGSVLVLDPEDVAMSLANYGFEIPRRLHPDPPAIPID